MVMRHGEGRLLTAANAVTAFRLLVFALFVYVAHRGFAAATAATFTLAWGLDAVDGWLARRLKQTTAFGFVFDKAVDRLVLVGGLFTLLVAGLVPLWSLLLLTKEVFVLPAVVRRRAAGQVLRDLGVAGKAAAACQGLALLWLLLGVSFGEIVTTVVAFAGGWAGWRYVRHAR